jgi:hypothetical protein
MINHLSSRSNCPNGGDYAQTNLIKHDKQRLRQPSKHSTFPTKIVSALINPYSAFFTIRYDFKQVLGSPAIVCVKTPDFAVWINHQSA